MKSVILFPVLLIALAANAATYECQVGRSLPTDAQKIDITVYEKENTSSVGRCLINVEKGCSLSFSDEVHYNEFLKSKKFYNLKGQSDLQIFYDLKFIDNDGQGILRFGKCKITSP